MSHVIGYMTSLNAGFGPDHAQPESSAGVYKAVVPSAKFGVVPDSLWIMLHFVAPNFPGKSWIEVDLGYSTDIFHADSGAEFWTRPISVTRQDVIISYHVDPALVMANIQSGGVRLLEVAAVAASNEPSGINPPLGTSLPSTNCDLFFNHLSQQGQYQDPVFEEDVSSCSGKDPPTWVDVAALSPSLEDKVIKKAADRVGLFVAVLPAIKNIAPQRLSSCSAVLIGTNKILTAAHCVWGEENGNGWLNMPKNYEDLFLATGFFTLDYSLDERGGPPVNYQPTFYKITSIARRFCNGQDFAVLGLGETVQIMPSILRKTLVDPNVEPFVFAVHHPRGCPKKVSKGTLVKAAPGTPLKSTGLSLDLGSSGSPLFDANGEIIGVNVTAAKCNVLSTPATAVTFCITGDTTGIRGGGPGVGPQTKFWDVKLPFNEGGAGPPLTDDPRILTHPMPYLTAGGGSAVFVTPFIGADERPTEDIPLPRTDALRDGLPKANS